MISIITDLRHNRSSSFVGEAILPFGFGAACHDGERIRRRVPTGSWNGYREQGRAANGVRRCYCRSTLKLLAKRIAMVVANRTLISIVR
jgi:hypothetical protein